MTFSFFEGPEKKLELTVVDGFPSLRSLGRPFWESVVAASRAQVISARSGEHFDAYLLSESSLFVYDSFVTMITCGRTRLVDAVFRILEKVPDEAIAVFVYERKNEHFPHEQPTSFYEDAQVLSRRMSGRAVRFGNEHEHAVRIFHTDRPYTPDPDDRTLEILMHGIDPAIASRVTAKAGGTVPVASRLGLGPVLEGYELDEYLFEPAGYSMNGMRGPSYLTVHVTPERVGSYVSVETNQDIGPDPSALVAQVVDCFRPESFDVVAFEPEQGPIAVSILGYQLRSHVQEPLSGYQVTFQHFFRPPEGVERAFVLDVG